MGTIVERKRQNGSVGYTAQIRIMRDGKSVHSEARTFEKRRAAQTWMKRREAELAEPDGLTKAKHGGITLADAIDRYIKESVREMGRTKAQVLKAIKTYDIAEMNCEDIESRHIVAFAREMQTDRTPQTVSNYLSHLSSIFAIGGPAWGFLLDQKAMSDAQAVCKRLGLTSRSRSRSRRPELAEIETLIAHYLDRVARKPGNLPMQRIIPFALFSTRRQEEITRIRWKDLDEEGSRIMVRDMKHPGEKFGNDQWCDLPPEALRIIRTMRGIDEERIFPYSSESISASFTRACQLLGIEDLTFHDLRHEGVSRLFEIGRQIPQAAMVSGHRSWNSLKRYSHIRQTGDKYEGWTWLDLIAPLPQLPLQRH